MARQVKPRHKLISSGRLTGCGRGQVNKKTVAKHVAPLDAAYSLYSTDSEDQVTTINKGLDRCAALLSGILQAEKTDSTQSNAKSHVPKMMSSKLKSKATHGKLEVEKRRLGKKSSLVSHSTKKPAPVQKTILCSQSYPGLRGQPLVPRSAVKPAAPTPVTQTENIQPHSVPLCTMSGGSNSLPITGVQPSTVFNCRLTTSTPVLSPPRPLSAHSQECPRGSDGEMRYFTQQWDIATGGQLHQQGVSNTAAPSTQYTASLSVAPTQVSLYSEAKEELRVSRPALSGAHTGAVQQNSPLESQKQPSTCSSPAMFSAHIPPPSPLTNHLQMHVLHSDSHGHYLSPEESSEESGGCTSEEEELAEVDTTPVRDTSCQTSMNKPTVKLNNSSKPPSPEKTARKVVTVKYLLGELKTLVANQDSEAVRLISEVEQSISLLPAMVGSTNVQAEIALALQPLRSENVQLRRRLRILNQQLMERERAERQARPADCNLELATLQSLNLTLQTQLNDSRRDLGNLEQENQRLQKALKDKENDLRQSKEECELETSRIRFDVSQALAQMRNCEAKLEDSEREKIALTRNLQQKEAEITRLQEFIKNLKKSPTRDVLCLPAQTDMPKPLSQLTKSVLDLFEDQQIGTAGTDRISDSVKTYLQTLEGTGHSTPPHQSHSLQSPSQWTGREEACMSHQAKACSPKCLDVPRLTQDNSAESRAQKGWDSDHGTAFVPLREKVRVQPRVDFAQKGSQVRANEGNSFDGTSGRPGLKYLGLAFEKLGISNELPTQDLKALDDNRGKDFLSHADGVGSQLKRTNEGTVNHLAEQSPNARRCLQMGDASTCTGRPSVFENTLSSCDIKSLASEWSVNSWSTFNTRDEQDFQKGLAALDASIASLQRTLKADLKLN
ncbi:coiled-coil domain-containing protein 14 [Hoplias malabaricus]|uniref:coiled-coil domain-containing protein 14 n=1 Tax=Hoplias malabaricus TaxID=27720 RepID=UPI0034630667